MNSVFTTGGLESERLATEVKFGDVITLQCIDVLGYVCTAGFDDKRVRVDGLVKGVQIPPNLKDCKFEVFGKRQYAARKLLNIELQKDMQRRARLGGAGEENRELVDAPSVHRRRASSIASRYAAGEAEHRSNELEFARNVGVGVRYGNVVQLRHSTTGEFITVKKERAEHEKHCLSVVLQEEGDEGSWFVVMPGYSTKVEGDRIIYGDVVCLASATFSNSNLRVSTTPLQRREGLVGGRQHPYVRETREVNASNESARFKIRPYSVHGSLMGPTFSKRLKAGDTVTIVHRATDTVLVFQGGRLYFEDRNPVSAEGDGERDTEQTRALRERSNSNALWKVESETLDWAGLPVRPGVSYRLKHMASATYLAVDSRESETAQDSRRGHGSTSASTLVFKAYCEVEYNNPNTNFQVHVPVAEGANAAAMFMSSEDVMYTSIVHCQASESKQYLSQFEERKRSRRRSSVAQQGLREQPEGILVNDRFQYGVYLNASSHDKDALSFAKVDEAVVSDLLRERAAYWTIANFVTDLREEVESVTDSVAGANSAVVVPLDVDSSPEPEHRTGESPGESPAQRRRQRVSIAISEEDERAAEITTAIKHGGIRDVLSRHGMHVVHTLERIVSNLSNLVETGATAQLSDYQLMLQEQRIIESVMDVLQVIFSEKSIPTWVLTNKRLFGFDLLGLCKLINRLIVRVCQGSRENKEYLVSNGWLALLQSLLGTEMKVAESIAEIYKENLELMQNVTDEEVHRYVSLLKKNKKPRFLRFLETICMSDGYPLPRNQNKVVKQLFDDLDVNQTFLVAKVVSEQFILSGDIAGSHVRFDIATIMDREEQIMAMDTSEMDPEELAYIYYIRMLNLFSVLCIGRNRLACDRLLKVATSIGITYDNLTFFSFSKDVPKNMRAAACALVTRLYVDREPADYIQPVDMTQIWMQSEANIPKDGLLALRPQSAGLRNDPFRDHPNLRPDPRHEKLRMQALNLVSELSSNRRLNVESMGSLDLALKTLHLVDMLLTYGFYGAISGEAANEEIATLVDGMIGLLDGRGKGVSLDAPIAHPRSAGGRSSVFAQQRMISAAEATFSRFESKSPQGMTLMKIKLTACKILKYAFDLRLNYRLRVVFDEYSKHYATLISSGVDLNSNDQNAIMAAAAAAVSEQEKAKKRRSGGGLFSSLFGGGNRRVASDDKNGMLSSKASIEEGLAMTVSDGEASLMSNLYDRLFRRAIIGQSVRAMDTFDPGQLPLVLEVLLDVSMHDYHMLQGLAFSLIERHLSQRAVMARHMTSTQVIVLEEVIAAHKKAGANIRELRRQQKWLSSEDVGRRNESRMICSDIMRQMTRLCTLGETLEAAGTKVQIDAIARQKFQVMLKNLGIEKCILDILHVPLNRKPRVAGQRQLDEPEDPSLRDLFGIVYAFLKVYVEGARSNQRTIFPHIALFQSHMGIDQLAVAPAISSCIGGNEELTAKVPVAFPRSIFQLIEDNGMQMRWLAVLLPLVVISQHPSTIFIASSKPIPKLQEVVMHLVFEYEDSMLVLFKDVQDWDRRRMLMRQAEHREDSSVLQYHATCLRIVAGCCFGKNAATEVKASGLLSITEVLDAILVPEARHSHARRMSEPDALGIGDSANVADERGQRAAVRLVRAAHIEFLHTVYTEAMDQTLLGNGDGDGQKNSIHNAARIWPDDANDDAGSLDGDGRASPDRSTYVDSWLETSVVRAPGELCLMESLIEDIKAATLDDGTEDHPRDLSMRAYVCGSVLPFLCAYFKKNRIVDLRRLSRRRDELRLRMIEAVKELTSAIAGQGPLNGRLWVTLSMLLQSQLEFSGAEAAYETKLHELDDDFWETENVRHMTHPGEKFKIRWKDFVTSFALRNLGIRSSAIFDPSLIVGVGERNMVSMLIQDGTVPNSDPKVSFVTIVQHLADYLASFQPSDDEELISRFLRILRGAVYTDQGDASDDVATINARDWAIFEKGEGILGTKRSRTHLRRVQTKYAEAGVAVAAARLLSHSNPRVSSEAGKLLIALTDEGNAEVQRMIFDALTSSSEGSSQGETGAGGLDAAFAQGMGTSKGLGRRGAAGGRAPTTQRVSATSTIDAGEFFRTIHSMFEQAKGEVKEYQAALQLSMQRRSSLAAQPGGGIADSISLRNRRTSSIGGLNDQARMTQSFYSNLLESGRLMEMMRLIQLLTEGHYERMQRLFQSQMSFVAESYDILYELVDLMETLHGGVLETFSQSFDGISVEAPLLVEVTTQAWSTLLELIQGPCVGNANSLMRSQYLSVAERFMSACRYSEDADLKNTDFGGANIITLQCHLKGLILDTYLALVEGTPSAHHHHDHHAHINLSLRPGDHDTDDVSAESVADEAGGEDEARSKQSKKARNFVLGRMIEVINYNALIEEAELIRMKCIDDWESSTRKHRAHKSHVLAQSLRQLTKVMGPREDRDDDAEASALRDHERLNELRSEALKRLFLAMELDQRDTTVVSKGRDQCEAPFCNKCKRVGSYCFGHAHMHTSKLENFYTAHTCSVEVVVNNRIEKVNFELTEECRFRKQDKGWTSRALQLIHNVPRPNPKEKIEAMIDRIVLLLFTMRRESQLQAMLQDNDSTSYVGIVGIIAFFSDDERYQSMLVAPFWVSMAAMIVLVLTYGESEKDWEASVASVVAVRMLSWAQVVLCMACFALFLVKESTIISFQARQRAADSGISQLLEDTLQLKGETIEASTTLAEAEAETELGPRRSSSNLDDWSAVFRNHRVWFMLLFLAAAFAAALSSPFFLSVHLLDFLLHSSAGQEVLESARVGGPMLARTMLIGLLVIVLYGIVSFVAFRDYLPVDERSYQSEVCTGGGCLNGADPEFAASLKHCSTLYECVGIHLVQGLMGSIGSVFGDPVNEWFPWEQVPRGVEDDSAFQVRTIYILSFIIIWGFLLSNIMTAQIVEAFVQIRSEKVEAQRDLEERCFICSLDRFTFEQRRSAGAKGFQHHLEHEHNPLYYLYYIDYLLTKDETLYTGIESYISRMLFEKRGKRCDWIPINRALQLEEGNAEAARKEEENKPFMKVLESTRVLENYVRALSDTLESRMARLESRIVGRKGSGDGLGEHDGQPHLAGPYSRKASIATTTSTISELQSGNAAAAAAAAAAAVAAAAADADAPAVGDGVDEVAHVADAGPVEGVEGASEEPQEESILSARTVEENLLDGLDPAPGGDEEGGAAAATAQE